MRTRLLSPLSAFAGLVARTLAPTAAAAPPSATPARPARGRSTARPHRRGARAELRRRPARRRRLPPAHGQRPVPDHRAAPRLRRLEGRHGGRRDRLRLESLVLRPPGLAVLVPTSRLRPLVRRAGLADARLRPRLAAPRRPALRGARIARAPRRPPLGRRLVRAPAADRPRRPPAARSQHGERPAQRQRLA